MKLFVKILFIIIIPVSISSAAADNTELLFNAVETFDTNKLKHLIESKADINRPNNSGHLLIFHAAACCNNSAVELLLKHNADIEMRNKWGSNLLEFITKLKNDDFTPDDYQTKMLKEKMIDEDLRSEILKFKLEKLELNQKIYSLRFQNKYLENVQKKIKQNSLIAFTKYKPTLKYKKIFALIEHAYKNKEILKKLTQEKLNKIFPKDISELITGYGYADKATAKSDKLLNIFKKK